MDIWQSNGAWYVNHAGKEYQFNTEQEARRTMDALGISEGPMEQEFAGRIIRDIVQPLRTVYAAMVAMQVEWMHPDFQDALDAARTNGTLLAGFPASTWDRLGGMMLHLQQFVATPIAALDGETPLSVLTRRYNAQVAP